MSLRRLGAEKESLEQRMMLLESERAEFQEQTDQGALQIKHTHELLNRWRMLDDLIIQIHTNALLSFKVPLLWVMKGSCFGFGSPQQQVNMHARSKNIIICIYFYLICWMTPYWPRTHCKFQEWQPHLNEGVSPVNYRSMCVRNSSLPH